MATNSLPVLYELQDVLARLRRCDGKTQGENRLQDLAKKLVEKVIAMQPATEAWYAQYAPDVKFSPGVVEVIDLLVSNRLPVPLEALVAAKMTAAGDLPAGVSALRTMLSRVNAKIRDSKCTFEIKVSGGMVSTATVIILTRKS